MMNYELNLENVRLRSLVEATETDLFDQKKKRRRLEKENAALVKRWADLGEHLNPETVKPTYWDYLTAKSIIETMKELQAGSK